MGSIRSYVLQNRRLVFIVSFLLATSLVIAAGPSVQITTPKTKANLKGTITVLAQPSDNTAFSYGILLVDDNGRSVANSLPLRFELDTTSLPNGMHKIRVDLFNEQGGSWSSPVIPVYFSNGLPAQGSAPVIGAKTAITAKVSPTKPAVLGNILTLDPSLKPVVITTTPAPATPPASLKMDGQLVNNCLPPFLNEGRMMVMLRSLIEYQGGRLSWDGTKATATINDHIYAFTLNESTVTVDGDQKIELDRPIIRVSNRIFVPVSAWHTLFQGGIAYDPLQRTVLLRTYESLLRAKLVM